MASYRVAPEPGGSRVTLEAELRGPLLTRILLFFLGGAISKGFAADPKKLKRLMARPPGSEPAP